TSLSSIVLPESITSIEYQCFYGCTSLESIYFHSKKPPYIYFYNFYLRSVTAYVPKESLELYIDTFKNAFKEILPIE
ncbi:MAG: leucine-rich repeat protein, partial [Bacteroidales bacterium]|nr:leucine-rich repeat protein [Bacteroidales bacterium]